MVLVSGYLIRQVAVNDADDIAKKHTGKLKTARDSGDYTTFASTLFLKLVPDGQLAQKVTGSMPSEKTYYNLTYKGIRNDTYCNYCSVVALGVNALTACLYYSPGSAYSCSQVRGGTYVSLNTYSDGPGHEYPSEALNCYVEDKSISMAGDIVEYHGLSFDYSIPILDSSNSKSDYEALVAAYVTSGTESDLKAIETFLKSHMFVYTRAEYKEMPD